MTVNSKENLRICYMVFSVSQTIRPRERGRLWAEEFLKHCGISKSYYDKHRSDVCGKGTTEENRNFRKANHCHILPSLAQSDSETLSSSPEP